MRTWKNPSKSGPGEYTTTLADNGALYCDCKGYLIKRKDKARCCRHIEDVIKELKLNTVQRGDFLFAVDNISELPAPTAPTVSYPDKLADAKAKGYFNPMLASAMTKRHADEPWQDSIAPYQDGNWLADIKYDGERVLLSKQADVAYFWSRPRPGEGELGLPNQKVGEHIRKAALYLPDVTVDGELVAGSNGKSYDVTNLANRDKQVLVLFDIIRIGDKTLLDTPLEKRHAILEKLVNTVYPGKGHPIVLAEKVPPTAAEVQRLWDAGAEGIILKRRTAIYRPGWRSPDWVKIKREFYMTGTVMGYEKAKNGPYSKVKLLSDEQVETSVKTKDNYWLKEFETNPDKYIGQRLVFKHYGPTPDGKYRGPIIWDHWAGEGE